MGDGRSGQSVPAATRAEIERNKARHQRELGAEQIRLADNDDTAVGSIRRQAAVLHIIAAVEHERVAADIDRSIRIKRGTSPLGPFLGVFMGEQLETTGVIRPGQGFASDEVDVTPGRPVRARLGRQVGPVICHFLAAEPMTDDPGADWVVLSVDPKAPRDGWAVDFP